LVYVIKLKIGEIPSAVELHLCGLIGKARHSDMQIILIIRFLFEKRLHWNLVVEKIYKRVF
jgi:hypothetical protein